MLQALRSAGAAHFPEAQQLVTEVLRGRAASQAIPFWTLLVKLQPRFLMNASIGHGTVELEWKRIGKHLVHHTAHAPYIRLWTHIPQQALWGHRGRSASNLRPTRNKWAGEPAHTNLCRAEITENNMRQPSKRSPVNCDVTQKQQIFDFYIFVHDPLLVEVHQCSKRLTKSTCCPGLLKDSPLGSALADCVQELSTLAKLADQRCLISIFKPLKYPQDMRMVTALHEPTFHSETLTAPSFWPSDGLQRQLLLCGLLASEIH
mmetsp:Transcript_43901/g.102611  ORF Transcript_43901/g.102611 Transcript_43901/m.102611 type:complete len:261 (-) Transcript_43901:254-1036(-)